MKKAEVVTIPAEKGVPAVEIRGRSGSKTSLGAGKGTKAGTKGAGKAAVMKKMAAGARKMTKPDPAKCARTVIIRDEVAEWAEKPTNDAGVMKTSAAAGARGPEKTKRQPKKAAGTRTTHTSGTKSTKRAKAKEPNEKITPASIYKKMIRFGKTYQVDGEQDFIEAARIYAEEAYLIDQMRDQIAEEGLTVMKTYKTGDVPVAHPLLSELPRHVESANKCLATIGNMIGERGARVEKAARDLDAFRLHAR